MGPVFYLVQSNEGLPPISAVLLGNWPHEFALAPSRGKRGGAQCLFLPCGPSLGAGGAGQPEKNQTEVVHCKHVTAPLLHFLAAWRESSGAWRESSGACGSKEEREERGGARRSGEGREELSQPGPYPMASRWLRVPPKGQGYPVGMPRSQNVSAGVSAVPRRTHAVPCFIRSYYVPTTLH